MDCSVVVVGGGVSGLSAAWRVRREMDTRGIAGRVLVLEREREVGGYARTDLVDGFRCEWGPNGFLDNEPRTLQLVDELNLRDRLVRSDDLTRRRFIYKNGRLHLLPESPRTFIRSRLLSAAGKARVLSEVVRPARRDGVEESVGDFGRRRLGAGFTSTFLDPMVSGIYAGDVDRLSLPATFPKVVELETRYGGLFRGMVALGRERRRGARNGRTSGGRADSGTTGGPAGGGGHADSARTVVMGRQTPGSAAGEMKAASAGPAGPGGVLHSFDEGIETLSRTLAAKLGEDVCSGAAMTSLHTGVAVTAVRPLGDGRYEVTASLPAVVGPATARPSLSSRPAGESPERIVADAVVLTVPAHVAAPLVAPWDAETAAALAEVTSAPISVVCLGYEREAVGHELDGFGALIPRSEGIRTLGVIFSSTVWRNRRAPADRVLMTVMIGGARDPGAAELSADEAVAVARRDLDPVLAIRAAPVFTRVYRHPCGIPQYTMGHMRRLAMVDRCEARHRGFFLGGNSLRGISINNCVKDAWRIGERVAAQVAGTRLARG